MSTWADFVAGVKSAYWVSGTPTPAQQYRALADYAHSLFVRQLESDIPLAKSFMDSYQDAKLRLGGSRITADLATTQTAVKQLLPVDADTVTNPGSTTLILDNAIETAYYDFNGLADNFDIALLNGAMDLQRHVPFYQGRNETIYENTTSGLVNRGFVSEIDLPTDFRIQAIWSGRFHTELVENVAFAADDIVSSNGRAYKVIVGGTLTTGQLGAGLTEQQYGVDEQLGSLTFRYHHDLKMVPVRKWAWADREALYSGRFDGGPVYTVSPQFDKLWLYPGLLDGKQFFMLEWVGIKTSYEDSDVVTFDRLAEEACAQWIRASLAKDVTADGRSAAAAMALYQKKVRDAVIDNQARDTGTTSTTSELLSMNLGGVPWWRWSTMNCTNQQVGIVNAGNSEADAGNSSGTTIIVPTTANQVQHITFTGASDQRYVVVKPFALSPTVRLIKGSRLVVFGSFPANQVGIAVSFRNNATDGTELASFTSDGVNLQIVIEFYFDGTAWQYLRAQIPA